MIVFRPVRRALVESINKIWCKEYIPDISSITQVDFRSKQYQTHLEMEIHFKQLNSEWKKRYNEKTKQISAMEITENDIFAY
jgi:hypothetical protein